MEPSSRVTTLSDAVDFLKNEWTSDLVRDPDSFIHIVTSPDDFRVVPYRMKKVRDHFRFSQQKKAMLDANENWVVAITAQVVHRALRGIYRVCSLFTTPECVEFLLPALKAVSLPCGMILIAEKAVFDSTIGLSLNKRQSAAAVINLCPTPVPLLPKIQMKSAGKGSEDLSVSLEPSALGNVIPFVEGASPQIRVTFPLLVLDDVRSSDNLGVIIRTAFSFGVPSLLCSTTSFRAINARASRVSMGAAFHMKVYVTPDIPGSLRALKAFYPALDVIGTSPTAREVLSPKRPTEQDAQARSWALVMGNEEKGLSLETINDCTRLVTIPQLQGDSLSVVAATAIALYALVCQSGLTGVESPATTNQWYFTPDLP